MNCTGYTHGIESGKYKSPKDFVKECLRQFGVLVHMRDDPMYSPIPTEIKVDKCYYEDVEDAKKQYEELLKKSDEDWMKALNQEMNEAAVEVSKAINKCENEKLKLKEYRDAIMAWEPDPRYAAVKEFCQEQLNMTEPEDPRWREEHLADLKNKTWQAYRDEELESARERLERYKKYLVEEESRVLGRNEYLQGFLKELEKIK